ncbi:FAD-dependent pyridine nucleotide-disulfide oxidoreductase [Penicillium malachiteum]|uniref:FAD-dependent pyridine nucleotide-disulfide oxidoreductase n=1 Tax=Penicillium malachiteum TaxID=1324776 RepID=UPI0025485013|nr:FAD-dependent pyridine nucleotide-disulfide oxidoreductase [Penicillium malachiteum]KAJ5729002.1 FAD-dependent pyridine nucleotide-disulfide oxidoreductase [Penicillium malachiteum]
MRTKKVAIIGAGPSGLVTAKTLLHNFPHGTFSPVIFDTRHEIGGLWPCHSTGTQRPPGDVSGKLDPHMPTNLSRFTVAFSDLSWESVFESSNIPMFPQARQVGLYLEAYRKRYIPEASIKLGHRVLKTVRTVGPGSETGWEVSWVTSKSSDNDSRECEQEGVHQDQVQVERFDLLVVASGYFARPYIPKIPGLEQLAGRVFHSSELQKSKGILRDDDKLLATGNIAIIGGSMSGVEAVSAIALHQSSHLHDENTYQDKKEHKVHHIHSRPFWTLPTYLPHETSTDQLSFMPLDLAMYDLSRRPPGPIDYSLGLVSEEKATKTNEYFASLLGPEYEKLGHVHDPTAKEKTASWPPWVAIGNDYAEFVRSGAIQATMGRAVSVKYNTQTELATITINTASGRKKFLKNIAAVVMATGYTPFDALSFLPEDVLSTLEYSTEDPFLPLVLDKGGTIRSEIPDLGFVGLYRGPYWGVMEMQARFLGNEWAGEDQETLGTEDQRAGVRLLRHSDSNTRRSQFPMGDYVGLMEAFARDLEIERTSLSNDGSRSGPVIPARYTYNQGSSPVDTLNPTSDTQLTLDALTSISDEDHQAREIATAVAVFRALHGTWTSWQTDPVSGKEEKFEAVSFSPRYSSERFDMEYVCHGKRRPGGLASTSIFRLLEATASGTANIEIWPGETSPNEKTTTDIRTLRLSPLYPKRVDGTYVPGEYIVYGQMYSTTKVLPRTGPDHSLPVDDDGSPKPYNYIFHFSGVSIVSWEFYYAGYICVKSQEETGQSLPHRIIYRR